MGALKAVAHANLVALCDLIVNRNVQIWESRAEALDELSILLRPVELSPRIVPYEIRREQLVDPAELSPMPNLLPNTVCQHFVFGRRHRIRFWGANAAERKGALVLLAQDAVPIEVWREGERRVDFRSMRRLRLGSATLLVWLLVCSTWSEALAQANTTVPTAERRPLNQPDESMTPRPVVCRPIDAGAPWDATTAATLRAIMRDTSSASDRAGAVAKAFPQLAKFEALESRACALIGHGVSSDRYAVFVDSVLPMVLAMHGDSAVVGDAPTLIAPPWGSRFDIYPRATTVSWHTVPNADHYLLEVEMLIRLHHRTASGELINKGWHWLPHNDGLNSAVVRDTVATFYFIAAQPGRWRVRAVFADGRSTPAADWRTFLYLR